MSNTKILTGKRALVFGASGTLGAAVTRGFASAGAEVFLSGRTKSKAEVVAKQITADGGTVQASAVDTLDDEAVNDYINTIVNSNVTVDVIVDLTGPLAKEYGNTKLAVDLPIEEFMVPLMTMVKSRFITARAAARQMVKQHSGVIILVTGSPARPHVPGATGFIGSPSLRNCSKQVIRSSASPVPTRALSL